MTHAGGTTWPHAWEWLRTSTLCPFARAARVRLAPAWRPDRSPEDNVATIATALAAFCAEYPRLRLHGFAAEIAAPAGTGSEEDRCVALFNWFVRTLLRHDGNSTGLTDTIESVDWQFSFAGRRLFLNLFAPHYPPEHTKHLPFADRVIIFAQPEEAFDYCGINADQHGVKQAIRRRFAAAGRPYPGELVDRRIEAHLYVFPTALDGAPVRWWMAGPD